MVSTINGGPATWVLLRGLTRGKHHWADFPGALQRALPGATIVLLDLPGNGDLTALRSPSSIDAMVQHLRDQLSATGHDKPVGIFAVSMGAMVAVQWALLWPQEVSHMVLVNSSFRGVSPFYSRLLPRSYGGLLGALVSTVFPRMQESIILKLTCNHPRQDVLNRWVEVRIRKPVSLGNALRQLWAAMRYRPALTNPPAKTLILGSQLDRLVSVQCSLAIASMWEARLSIHPSAGHDLTLDDSDWVAKEMHKFLGQCPCI